MPEDPTPGVAACAYCEAAPAVLCHLWLSDAWDRAPLCRVCQGYVLADPHLPRLVGDDDAEDALTLIDEATPFFEDAFAGVLECIELRPLGDMLKVVALVASSDRLQLDRCLRVFDDTWWLANCHRSNGLLVFDYETVAQTGDPHA